MDKQTQQINYNEINDTDRWSDYNTNSSNRSTPTLPIFTNNIEDTIGKKLIDKQSGKVIYNIHGEYNKKDECLICYEKINNASKVTCKLCKNMVHYRCYKHFTEKNPNYYMKCCHCSTNTLKFDIKRWFWCCW